MKPIGHVKIRFEIQSVARDWWLFSPTYMVITQHPTANACHVSALAHGTAAALNVVIRFTTLALIAANRARAERDQEDPAGYKKVRTYEVSFDQRL